MKKKIGWVFGMLAFVLIFGMMVVSCLTDANGQQYERINRTYTFYVPDTAENRQEAMSNAKDQFYEENPDFYITGTAENHDGKETLKITIFGRRPITD